LAPLDYKASLARPKEIRTDWNGKINFKPCIEYGNYTFISEIRRSKQDVFLGLFDV
jgi:hypothetical protein